MPRRARRVRGKIGARLAYIASVLVDRGYLDLEIWPNLVDYFDRLNERPPIQSALAAEGLLDRRIRRTG